MKGSKPRLGAAAPRFIILGLALFAAQAAARAQEMISAAPPQETVQEATPAEKEPQKETEADALQRRVARARALAAVGKLAAAASDLEAVRASTADESARDVARILLMSIYVEMPDYTRAGSLLEETFEARAAQGEATKRAYYALAGQTVKSVRVHLERYRSFGIDVADGELPAEANGDLNQLRQLLERVTKQAKAIREEEEKAQGRGTDATALLEDAASVRLRLARTGAERADWRREISDARQRLFIIPETRIASIGGVPPARPPAAPSPTPVASSPTPVAQPAVQGSVVAETQAPATNAAAAPEAVREATNPASAAAPPDAATAGGEAGKATTGGPVAVGSLVSRATQRISPSYPPLAKTAGITGIVTVFVLVNEKGEVETVERADGPAQLQRAATEAARRWRFRPTVVDGQPVRVTGYLSFNFTL